MADVAWVKSARQLERERLRRRAGVRSALGAGLSTAGVLALAAVLVVRSPGWSRVQETFFSGAAFRASLPEVLEGFWLNVRIFLVAEPLILLLGLLVAVARSLRSAVLFPLRALATVYTDVFRG